MTTFALVHGAWHGPWCWEDVSPLLERAGHDVLAAELPSEDGSADFDVYADVVCAALQERDGDVIVVGHSLGGPTATLVSARRPVRHVAYLCAAVPEPGRTFVDQMQRHPDMVDANWAGGLSDPDEQLRTRWVDSELARHFFYDDCDEHVAMAAFERLRPQAAAVFTAPLPLAEYPAVARTYVVCADDRLVSPSYQRSLAQTLDADVVELPGSHSPMLSRPSAVADILLSLAAQRI
jgi:pimeloyl-ACP methyl ester carboxylesterase